MSKPILKRGRGRPRMSAEPMGAVVHLKIPEEAMQRIERLRTQRIVPPSINALVREAVLVGLAAMEKGKGHG